MREIKFRAWNKYPNGNKNANPIMQYNAQNWGGFGDICKDDSNLILMQFTGLKDKNGKDIYEGDIVENDCYGKMNIIVEYKEGYFTIIHNKGGLLKCKVIGNIYENPELLKEVKRKWQD